MMKDVPNFENEYSATEDGRIFSKRGGRFLNRNNNFGGYVCVSLCKKGKKYPTRVHRVIAITFLPNPLNLKDVNHKNGIKTDNRLENLEWVSRSENQKHAYKELGRVPVTGVNHPKYKPIVDSQTGIFYHTSKEAALAKCLTRDQVKSGLRAHGEYKGLLYA